MRSHLLAIVLAVVAVFLGAGSFIVQTNLDTARQRARESAAHQADVAADAVAANVAVGATQVSALASNPGVPQLLTSPAACNLAFTLDLFPGSHLDLVRPDGRVGCSSADLGAPTTHADAPWLAELATTEGILQTGSFLDPVTNQSAVAIGSPVRNVDGGALGAVVLVLPTAGIADQLAESYGGPRGYEFALTDTSEGSTLSASSGSSEDGGNALLGDRYVAGSKPVPGTTWRSDAAVLESAALGPARSVVLRGVLLGVAVLAVLLLSLAVVNRRIARPLRRLTSGLGDTGPHAHALLASVTGPREIVQLAGELQAAIAAHEAYEEQLSHQALHDPLTGLPNRALLAERLTHSLEQATLSGQTVAVLCLDLDRFKLVNDSLGHAVGDQVLIAVAARLTDVLRPGDTLARFAGDEFVIVGEGLGSADDAERLAERLLTAVEAPVEAADTIVRISASVGIALSTISSRSSELVRDADTAMALAKQHGGARYEVFDRELRDQVTARLTVENEFRVALERHELHLVYQPKVDVHTGDVVGVEALLRWDHPALGSIPPDTFIPIAEKTGLIVPVGRFVLEKACRQAAAWHRQGIHMPVAVNISGRQLADADLVQEVARILAETGLEPHHLCLELTESVLMYDTVRAARTLRQLHDVGVELSVDDFGTGYSSLAYLHRFPVDELKIDRVFVHGLTERADQRTLVPAMVAMATALGLRVVAEGVETREQAVRLQELGCHIAQGYLFARPQAPELLSFRPLAGVQTPGAGTTPTRQ